MSRRTLSADDGSMRLAKRVAELKGCSRSDAERYIEGGWVSVNGEVVEEPAMRVTHEAVAVSPDATLLDGGPITLLLHKLVGYESGLGEGSGPQGSRSRGAPSAMDLLTHEARSPDDRSGIRILKRHANDLEALAPLPTEASGLAVFSQDFRIVRKLTEDIEVMEQEVMAEVRGTVSPEALARLCHGLSFNGRPLPPIKVSISSDNPDLTRLRFALKGIRPGQVPAMCEAVGLKLLALKRIRLGRVALAGLAPGQWRYLLPHERF